MRKTKFVCDARMVLRTVEITCLEWITHTVLLCAQYACAHNCIELLPLLKVVSKEESLGGATQLGVEHVTSSISAHTNVIEQNLCTRFWSSVAQQWARYATNWYHSILIVLVTGYMTSWYQSGLVTGMLHFGIRADWKRGCYNEPDSKAILQHKNLKPSHSKQDHIINPNLPYYFASGAMEFLVSWVGFQQLGLIFGLGVIVRYLSIPFVTTQTLAS